jgi:hypothetical protein
LRWSQKHVQKRIPKSLTCPQKHRTPGHWSTASGEPFRLDLSPCHMVVVSGLAPLALRRSLSRSLGALLLSHLPTLHSHPSQSSPTWPSFSAPINRLIKIRRAHQTHLRQPKTLWDNFDFRQTFVLEFIDSGSGLLSRCAPEQIWRG